MELIEAVSAPVMLVFAFLAQRFAGVRVDGSPISPEDSERIARPAARMLARRLEVQAKVLQVAAPAQLAGELMGVLMRRISVRPAVGPQLHVVTPAPVARPTPAPPPAASTPTPAAPPSVTTIGAPAERPLHVPDTSTEGAPMDDIDLLREQMAGIL